MEVIQELIEYIIDVHGRADTASIESGREEPLSKRARCDRHCLATDLGYGMACEIIATADRAWAELEGTKIAELRAADGVLMIDVSCRGLRGCEVVAVGLNRFFGACGLAICARTAFSHSTWLWLEHRIGHVPPGEIKTLHLFSDVSVDPEKAFPDDLRQLNMINNQVYLGITDGINGVFLPPHNYTAARDATMEWLLTAQVLQLDRHVAKIIAMLVWWSRLDYGTWLNKKVTGYAGLHQWQRTYFQPFCQKLGIPEQNVAWVGVFNEGDDQLE